MRKPIVCIVLLIVAGAVSAGCSAREHLQMQLRAQPTSDAGVDRTVVLGYSVEHRPVIAREIGDPDSGRRVLIVGCIHGNEPAGIAIARAVSHMHVPPEIDLWVVTDLNPDGVARRTRGNAHGVDLNRNFPHRWRVLGPAGSTYYAGPHSLSEPESRAIAGLIRRLRPALAIWYHQHLNVIDTSEGPSTLVRRYAADTRMRLARLVDEPGSATGYMNYLRPHTAFVVELPPGQLSTTSVLRHARAALDLTGHAP